MTSDTAKVKEAHHPAAFINVIREEGSKYEACDWLQKTWNELCESRKEIERLEAELERWICVYGPRKSRDIMMSWMGPCEHHWRVDWSKECPYCTSADLDSAACKLQQIDDAAELALARADYQFGLGQIQRTARDALAMLAKHKEAGADDT